MNTSSMPISIAGVKDYVSSDVEMGPNVAVVRIKHRKKVGEKKQRTPEEKSSLYISLSWTTASSGLGNLINVEPEEMEKKELCHSLLEE